MSDRDDPTRAAIDCIDAVRALRSGFDLQVRDNEG
jgi:hypothetical protein